MPTYRWRSRPTKHFGDTYVPFAQVSLRANDSSFHVLALQIDTGAVVSLLRQSMAELLGIDLESGRRVELGSIGGTQTVAFVHNIYTKFCANIEYVVPFAIATNEIVPNLLGRSNAIDCLHFDFDGTLQETRITAPWLEQDSLRIRQFIIDSEKVIIANWQQLKFSDSTYQVVNRFLNRAGQLYASAESLLRMHCTYGGPLFIRSLFELAVQFQYLMDDPDNRAKDYIDFAHITKYHEVHAVTKTPRGPIAQYVADSPLRPKGAPINEKNYLRVRPQFMRSEKKEHNNWYKMSVAKLAEEVGWLGEYNLVFKSTASWSHGDPFSTSQQTNTFGTHELLFTFCMHYYARILLTIADKGSLSLSREQSDALNKLSAEFA